MAATREAWTTDETGHLVGDDGFVVPKTFAEFYERFPDYAKRTALAYLRCDVDTVEDTTQTIWALLMRNRVIEKFDPARMRGCNQRRFYWYLGMCVRRRAITTWNANNEEPSHNAVSIDGDVENGFTEERVHVARLLPVTELDLTDQLFIDQFKRYVSETQPKMAERYMTVLDGLAAGETRREMAQRLAVVETRVSSYMTTLVKLAKLFQHRDIV